MSANKIKNLAVVVVVAAYLMMPADLVNDVAPVVGQLDDTVVALLGLLAAMKQVSGPGGGDGAPRGGDGKRDG